LGREGIEKGSGERSRSPQSKKGKKGEVSLITKKKKEERKKKRKRERRAFDIGGGRMAGVEGP